MMIYIYIPLNPELHLQKNPFSLSSHSPFSLHGLDEHMIISVSHFFPYHPGWQLQIKLLSTSIQDPPLLHGSEEQSTIGNLTDFVPSNTLYCKLSAPKIESPHLNSLA